VQAIAEGAKVGRAISLLQREPRTSLSDEVRG
jgi:hypothetical protein